LFDYVKTVLSPANIFNINFWYQFLAELDPAQKLSFSTGFTSLMEDLRIKLIKRLNNEAYTLATTFYTL
jgi:hypothetical protein